MPPMPGRCDHCNHKADLKTHLLPWSTKPNRQGPDRPVLAGMRCLLLCERCGDQRQQDLRRFFRGGRATELVAIEPPPEPPGWEAAC